MGEDRHKPKVAIVTPGTFSVPSDYSSSVERVADELSRRMAEKVQIYAFSKNNPGFAPGETILGVTHIRPVAATRRGYLAATIGSLRQIGPDLIQVENRPSFIERIKTAVSCAEVWLSLHSVTFLSPQYISRPELCGALSAADRIVVNSRFLQEEIGRRFPIYRPKISVNHPGADDKLFISQWEPEGRKLREDFKKRLGCESKQIVLFAGRLLPIKGVHHLLEVWPDVIKRHPHVMLLVIGSAFYGSGKLTPYVKKLHAKGNEMPGRVRFLSYCPYSDMPEWFRIADVVVVPSEAMEAFGLVNAEAMASGAPVIASDSGGIKEIVRDGENGYLIKLDVIRKGLYTRLCELLEDEEKRKRMGECGARTVREHFSWQRAAQRQIELYHRYSHIFRSAGNMGESG